MTQEEFKELSTRFYEASRLQAGIYQCQEKLKLIENAGPHTFDDLTKKLRDLLPNDCVDKWLEDMKDRAKRTLRGQIKLYEQKFKEL